MKSRLRNIILNMEFSKKLCITYIVLLMIFVIPIGVISYHISYNSLLDSEYNMMGKNLEQARYGIDTNLEWYAQKSDILFYNSMFQEMLRTEYQTVSEKVDAITKVSQYIEGTFYDSMVDEKGSIVPENLRLGNVAVKVYAVNDTLPFDGTYLHLYDSIAEEDWTVSLRTLASRYQWRYDADSKGNAYLVYDRALIHFGTQEFLGILSIYIPVNRMQHIMEQANSTSSAYLVLQHNEGLVWSDNSIEEIFINDTEQLFDGIEKNGRDLINIDGHSTYLCKKTELKTTDWKLAMIVDNKEILVKLNPFTHLFVVLILVSIAFAVVVSLLVAKQITKRLRDMTQHVELLESDPTYDLPVIAGNDEVGRLDRHLHNMVNSLRNYKSREQEYEYNQAILQIDLLRAQINPHLLYNTMAAISWNAKKLGSTSIQKVTDNMIRFYRNYLNRGSPNSTVKREIEMVTNYIEIMKYTYELDIEVQIDVDPSILNVGCANLFLQPFVENAIVHGLRAKRETPRKLGIFGNIENDMLCFVVSDNGVGMDVQKLNSLFSETVEVGYGISNIKKRMELYYKNQFAIDIQSALGKGTQVKMLIPM